MSSNLHFNEYWVMILSCLAAMILQIMPWPNGIYMFKPAWIELIIIYWVLTAPYKINVGCAFLVGLFWDLLAGSVFGSHALQLSIIAYIVASREKLILPMPLWQQSLIVILLSFITIIINLVLEFCFHHIYLRPEIIWKGLMNGLFWPWIYLVMQKIYPTQNLV